MHELKFLLALESICFPICILTALFEIHQAVLLNISLQVPNILNFAPLCKGCHQARKLNCIIISQLKTEIKCVLATAQSVVWTVKSI